MLIYHRFQGNQCVLVISACHMLVSEHCLVLVNEVNSVKMNNAS